MAAFDALTGPVLSSAGEEEKFTFQADSAPALPARKPLSSWAAIETASVVESPADDLFGTEPAGDATRTPAKLGEAFADFSVNRKESSATFGKWSAADTEPSTPEPSGAQQPPPGASAPGTTETTYDEPIGPQRRPEGLPRRGERSATTIASLLTEALAAYQATTDTADEQDETPRFTEDTGRHRSPE
ncbi:hypothetical protein [Actinophytocola sp.]|uniref:hypothetical protein n=1 Tax=Actinophytocola sp. TaxID=1872138 RepID=UPI002D273619|nr:hypothetical protein [Actinophytocola sp.]HYQ66755.1 hypothetical protein [Actinophytocola sp.]